jgi:hypothetical protein
VRAGSGAARQQWNHRGGRMPSSAPHPRPRPARRPPAAECVHRSLQCKEWPRKKTGVGWVGRCPFTSPGAPQVKGQATAEDDGKPGPGGSGHLVLEGDAPYRNAHDEDDPLQHSPPPGRCPREPSHDPSVKRPAIQTEEQPLECAGRDGRTRIDSSDALAKTPAHSIGIGIATYLRGGRVAR